MVATNTDIEKEIAEIEAKYAAQAKIEIEQLQNRHLAAKAKKDLKAKLIKDSKDLEAKHSKKIKDAEADHAKALKKLAADHAKDLKDLEATQKIEVFEFESKYGVEFEMKAKKPVMSVQAKCDYVMGLKDKNGNPKFSIKNNEIIGAKGEAINSTIIFKDATGAKQSLSVGALVNHLR